MMDRFADVADSALVSYTDPSVTLLVCGSTGAIPKCSLDADPIVSSIAEGAAAGAVGSACGTGGAKGSCGAVPACEAGAQIGRAHV